MKRKSGLFVMAKARKKSKLNENKVNIRIDNTTFQVYHGTVFESIAKAKVLDAHA